jgi:putative restriction endonuclease
MNQADRDTLLRMAAFEHVRRLGEVHDHLTAAELKPGFVFRDRLAIRFERFKAVA